MGLVCLTLSLVKFLLASSDKSSKQKSTRKDHFDFLVLGTYHFGLTKNLTINQKLISRKGVPSKNHAHKNSLKSKLSSLKETFLLSIFKIFVAGLILST